MAPERTQETILLNIFPKDIREQLPTLIRSGGLGSLLKEHEILLAKDPLYRFQVLPRIWFYNFLERLYQLDQEIASDPAKALEEFLKASKIDYQVSMSEKLKDRMKTGPWIFYGRHPSQLEPFLMLAAIFKQSERPDVEALAADYMLKLLPRASSFLVPVYSGDLERSLEQQPSFWEKEKRKLMNLLRDPIPKEEARARNTQTVNDLSGFVEHGGMVFITPKMGGGKSGWQKGIGRIIEGISPEADVTICPVSVRGRLGMSSFFRRGRYEVCFGEPLTQPDLLNRVDQINQVGLKDQAAVITDVLKSHYEQVFKT